MRLFVALPLPAPVVETLTGLTGGIPGARWVPPENLHLTLAFIGEVDGGAAAELAEALEGVRSPPFTLHLQGIGTFDRGRSPRALWIAAPREAALVQLQGRVISAIEAAGLEPERRRFTPHVTLARLKHPDPARLGRFIQAHNLIQTPPFTVDEFCLFSSHLRPDGPSYRREAEYPFG
ncbi:RNA 2',3'-cyclic phosphodiesterase [Roseospirillum parvum]|uniref:RNA 2',3'-cyclic phosphodiesterase n=1 Tax=Roseospirillum parvum TaxID=83401 RepID=A0A1G8B6W5_9PROT|nr:RNA 2',3'-cyclic phosphodiesterase [Roseospirillum parvum]SDH28881.1 2'-5' RNA ligase [Roseospirillum parvum]